MSDSTTQCEFVFDQEQKRAWYEGGREVIESKQSDSILWKCPFPPTDEGVHCIFHQPVSDKDVTEVESALNSLLAKDGTKTTLIGGRFGHVDLTSPSLTGDQSLESRLDLSYSMFAGDVDCSRREFDEKVSFENCVFDGRLIFDWTRFAGGVDFTGAEFHDECSFEGAKFGAETVYKPWISPERAAEPTSPPRTFERSAQFEDTVFDGSVNFMNATFEHRVRFAESTFHENCQFYGVTFHSYTDFTSSRFDGRAGFAKTEWNGRASFRRATFRRKGVFKQAEFEGPAYFSESDFEGAGEFTGSGGTESLTRFDDLADFTGSTLDESDLRWVEFEGPVSFRDADLTNTLLDETSLVYASLEGAILIRASLSGTDLRGARLSGTTIEGVHIDDETNFLDRVGSRHPWWSLRSEQGYCVYDPDFGGAKEVVDVSRAKAVYRVLEDVGRHNVHPSLQTRCFVRRKQLQRVECRETATNTDASLRQRVDAFFQWSQSRLAELIFLYGESPWRVVGTSLVTILGFALTYPIGGWIRPQGGRPLTYGQITTNLRTVGDSMYYSVLTFTSLGFGDFTPVGFGRVLTSVETSLGAVLIALLVFVLGRRAAR